MDETQKQPQGRLARNNAPVSSRACWLFDEAYDAGREMGWNEVQIRPLEGGKLGLILDWKVLFGPTLRVRAIFGNPTLSHWPRDSTFTPICGCCEHLTSLIAGT